eukprot:COSAG02_NODE_17069_length_1031_cov_0.801502_2_plen_80_part_01
MLLHIIIRAECQNTAKTPRNASAAVQYLVIGDSISMGMNSYLSDLVSQDGWALNHNPGNAASSNLGEGTRRVELMFVWCP